VHERICQDIPMRHRAAAQYDTEFRHCRLGMLNVHAYGCDEFEWEAIRSQPPDLAEKAWRMTSAEWHVSRRERTIELAYIGQEADPARLPAPVRSALRHVRTDGAVGGFFPTYGVIILCSSTRQRIARAIIHEVSHVRLERWPWKTWIPTAAAEGYAELLVDEIYPSFTGTNFSHSVAHYRRNRQRCSQLSLTDLLSNINRDYYNLERLSARDFIALSIIFVRFLHLALPRFPSLSDWRRLRWRVLLERYWHKSEILFCGLPIKRLAEEFISYRDNLMNGKRDRFECH
jgi:hypothetical protein